MSADNASADLRPDSAFRGIRVPCSTVDVLVFLRRDR